MNTAARIVSLIASSTEIVCALGFEKQLVGRSHECDYPPAVKELPCCTEPKFGTDGTSYEIDQRVRAVLQEALSVYRVHADMLEKLQPTHIITQTQCEVCAVSLRDVESAACHLISSRPTIVSLESNVLPDVWRDIIKVGEALEARERAQALVESLIARLNAIAASAATLSAPKRLAFVEWIEPLLYGGNWMPELIGIAGGVACKLEDDPEAIVVAPCGFDIERTRQEVGALARVPDWQDLSAVTNGHVYIADGNQFFNRPGPRLVESAEILAEIMHPQLFNFGHAATGWVRVPPP
jgi:iron complex transport system substrate-binding protein